MAIHQMPSTKAATDTVMVKAAAMSLSSVWWVMTSIWTSMPGSMSRHAGQRDVWCRPRLLK